MRLRPDMLFTAREPRCILALPKGARGPGGAKNEDPLDAADPMTALDTDELVRELSRSGAYPLQVEGPVERVELRQTHVSLLFFAGERVYKLKKPVDFGFLDFTGLERRRFYCEEEVRLNRRLAPEMYLGTRPVTRGEDGHLRFGGEGTALEWAVEMVRLPDHRMLARLCDRGEVDNDLMNVLALLFVEFHAEAPTGPGVDEHGSPAAVTAAVEQNFEQLAPFVELQGASGRADLPVLSSLQHVFLRTRARGFLAGERELLERRVAEGRIREGHGDLHAENICLSGEVPVVYDCIEFNRGLRCLDVANDIAFLAMDLDQRGLPAFSRYFVRGYARLAHDPELPSLVDFYKGYRAVVRGKVAALTAAGLAPDEPRREEERREAQRYLQLACGYDLGPALVLLCGLPASGKSFLAPHLGRPLRAALLHSDVRRKARSGLDPRTSARAAYDTGLYSPEQRRATYRSLLEDVATNLGSGRSALVDATFLKAEFRVPFVDAATRLGVPYVLVQVVADDAVIRARLARAPETREGSDADLAVYLRAREEFEPPLELPGGHVLELPSPALAPEEASSLLIDRLIHLQASP